MAVATISVNFASLAEARAGTSTVTSINPKQLRDMLQSGSNLPWALNINGLQSAGAITTSSTIQATNGYNGNFVASGSVTGTGWSGNLSISGNVTATNGWNGALSVAGNISGTGNISATNGWNGNLSISGNVTATNGWNGALSVAGAVTATGNITSSGGSATVFAAGGWNGALIVNGNLSTASSTARNINGGASGWQWSGALSVTGGNITTNGSVFGTNGWSGNLAVGGTITATGEITAFFSDSRLKTIKGTIENALEKVNNLTAIQYVNNDVAKSFGYADDESKIGLIAQDVKKVLPEVVKLAPFDVDVDGKSKSGENYLTVQYHLIVPLLVEAIKTLSKKVESLESQLRGN